MRKIVAIIVLLALIVQCTYQLDCYAWFKLNQDYIAKNLCINRAKPQLHCGGKCFLMKKIKENREKQEQQNIKNLEVLLWVNNQVINYTKNIVPKVAQTRILFIQQFYEQPSLSISTPPPNRVFVS